MSFACNSASAATFSEHISQASSIAFGPPMAAPASRSPTTPADSTPSATVAAPMSIHSNASFRRNANPLCPTWDCCNARRRVQAQAARRTVVTVPARYSRSSDPSELRAAKLCSSRSSSSALANQCFALSCSTSRAFMGISSPARRRSASARSRHPCALSSGADVRRARCRESPSMRGRRLRLCG